SSVMAAPFEFATDVIPEPLFRGLVRDVVKISTSAEFGERYGGVQPAGFIEGPIQTAVGNDAPVATALPTGKLVKGRCAIRAYGVVPAGRLVQSIDRAD